MSIEVKYLADCPEFVPLLASWFYDGWGHGNRENALEKAEKRLRQRLNRDRVPLTWVAFQGSEPVGSASLIVREMKTHPQYLHWLASVYVHPSRRQQGVGSLLVEHAASEAARLGVRELYLYTHSHEGFYARLGWRPVERPLYRGREVVIMKRVLET